MSPTLVLNNDFTPLSVIPIHTVNWKEAIRMSFLGQCDTVESYADWVVHSPSRSMLVPSILVSNTYVKKKQVIRFTRNNLLIRDNFRCQYCGTGLTKDSLTVDHVVPRVRGGKTKWENIACACQKCNSEKGHKTNMKPMQVPYKPDYYNLLANAKKLPIVIPDPVWIQYLDWDPNLVKIQVPNKKAA